MAKKLLQINVTANWGSTGKIAEQIGVLAQNRGWESYIAYGRYMNASKNKLIKIGSALDTFEHYLENRLFDNEGRASRRATRKFIRTIEEIKPDVIHLHNIHDHYLNFPILFRYIAEKKIPVVWTQHDLWSITGHCAFNLVGCEKWKTQCENCPITPSCKMSRCASGFNAKKMSFTSIEKMTIVPVSEWLASQVEQSFLGKYPIKVIKNGIDINLFHPNSLNCLEKYGLKDSKYVIAVASVWSRAKGFTDYINIRKELSDDIKIVLVGLSEQQIAQLPNGMIGISRTQSQLELAQLYSGAEVLLSLSRFETFGLTIAEALSCGTPVIVYNNSAQPELVDEYTGRVVPNEDFHQAALVIKDFIAKGFKHQHSQDCRNRAAELFYNNRNYDSYIQLYGELMGGVR